MGISSGSADRDFEGISGASANQLEGTCSGAFGLVDLSHPGHLVMCCVRYLASRDMYEQKVQPVDATFSFSELCESSEVSESSSLVGSLAARAFFPEDFDSIGAMMLGC